MAQAKIMTVAQLVRALGLEPMLFTLASGAIF